MLTDTLLNLSLHLKLVGLSSILLGLSHALFGRRFGWKEEFARVSLLNRQIFYVHCFFIALVVTLLGVLSLVFTEALLEPTRLGRILLSGIVLFWSCRLLFQFFVYDASLWRGHRFNTRVHILFILLWTYYIAIFGWALQRQCSTTPPTTKLSAAKIPTAKIPTAKKTAPEAGLSPAFSQSRIRYRSQKGRPAPALIWKAKTA